MQGVQFAQFSTEVLQGGAEAILPQNLPDHWLDALLEEAELLEASAEDEDPMDESDPEDDEAPEDDGAPQTADRVDETFAGLLGAVLALLMAQQGHPEKLEIATSTLFAHMQLYVMALAAESVSRWSEFLLEPPPTAANIFDPAREVQARRRGGLLTRGAYPWS